MSFSFSIRRDWSRAPLATALLASSLWASPAHAQAPSGEVGEGEELVREGVRLRRAHQNEEALTAFRRAYLRDQAPSTRAQIALAEQALARWIDAENDLVSALSAQDAWVEHHRAELEESLRTIGEHLAWIRVEANAPWAEIALDGAHVDERREVRTTAGVHHLIVKDGDVTEARDIEVAPGDHARAIFMIESKGAGKVQDAPLALERTTRDPAPVPSSSSHEPSRIAPLVLGGVGAAGIAVGSYFGIRAIIAKGDRRDHCNGDNACDPMGIEADGRLRTSATASSLAFIAGAACIGAAVTWWILQSPRGAIRTGLGGPSGILGATLMGTFE